MTLCLEDLKKRFLKREVQSRSEFAELSSSHFVFSLVLVRWWRLFSAEGTGDLNWIRLRKPLVFLGALGPCLQLLDVNLCSV